MRDLTMKLTKKKIYSDLSTTKFISRQSNIMKYIKELEQPCSAENNFIKIREDLTLEFYYHTCMIEK